MLHFILYVSKNRNIDTIQNFDKMIDYFFTKMEMGGFTFDIKYIEDNISELNTNGITDYTQPIMKDIDGSFVIGEENIKPIIDAIVSENNL